MDRDHNLVGSRPLEPDPQRLMQERLRMLQYPYVLGREARAVVLASLRRHCAQRGWAYLPHM